MTASAVSLPENAIRVLEARYLIRDDAGNIVETPDELLDRVANAIAEPEKTFLSGKLGESNYEYFRQEFRNLLANNYFWPNSPTLSGAGRPLGQLSACYVLPVGDSIEEIFDTVKHAAVIHQSGGGTGFDFSELRSEGSLVKTTSGVASGPVSFMKVFDGATEAIKQGGCFVGSQEVLTERGPVAIQDLTAGTNVYAFNRYTGEFVLTACTDAFPTLTDTNIWRVILSDGQEILATPNHPFWVWADEESEDDDGNITTIRVVRQIPLQELTVGQELITFNKNGSDTAKTVKSVEDWGFDDVYNVEVPGPHNYVICSNPRNGVVVSNTRRGANMGILRVDHPDIRKFITMKADMKTLENFNISVAITNAFMQALKKNQSYDLVDPHSKKIVRQESAREIWDLIVKNAWKNGDPGLVFIDRINASASNPVPDLGPVRATNPCGESPLYAYDSCNLGSINLAAHVQPNAAGVYDIDKAKLKKTIWTAIRFLDNVIEANKYPLPEIDFISKQIRRVGLGVMGFADVLYMVGIPYNSDEAVAYAKQLMRFISEEADYASEALAAERGVFPAWEKSIYGPHGANRKLRNSNRTIIAPTGTLSILAGVTGGIEPAFSLAFKRQHRLDKANPNHVTVMYEVNEVFKQTCERLGIWDDSIAEFLCEGNHLAEHMIALDHPELLDIFVTTHDIAPEWHVKIQAAFQHSTDNAVSKTINFTEDATETDIKRAYWLAWEEGCKGITIYRDGSRELQVLSHDKKATTITPTVLHAPAARSERIRLPMTRQAVNHSFVVGGVSGYITVGLYENGTPGELFLRVAKQGSTLDKTFDGLAISISLGLQRGVPLSDYIEKLSGMQYEPAGMTNNREIPMAKSITDYIFTWLKRTFYPEGGDAGQEQRLPESKQADTHGNGCPECGGLLIYAEGCEKCPCGYSAC